MTKPNQSPISRHDICDQVILMGRDVTENIEAIAQDMAGRLAKYGVAMTADGIGTDANQLSLAASAKLECMAKFASEDVGIMQEIIAVSAAVSTILGDLANPAIGAVQNSVVPMEQETIGDSVKGVYISDGGPDKKLAA